MNWNSTTDRQNADGFHKKNGSETSAASSKALPITRAMLAHVSVGAIRNETNGSVSTAFCFVPMKSPSAYGSAAFQRRAQNITSENVNTSSASFQASSMTKSARGVSRNSIAANPVHRLGRHITISQAEAAIAATSA